MYEKNWKELKNVRTRGLGLNVFQSCWECNDHLLTSYFSRLCLMRPPMDFIGWLSVKGSSRNSTLFCPNLGMSQIVSLVAKSLLFKEPILRGQTFSSMPKRPWIIAVKPKLGPDLGQSSLKDADNRGMPFMFRQTLWTLRKKRHFIRILGNFERKVRKIFKTE